MNNTSGTNADHAKNTLTNCAYRKKYTGEDKKDKKRGIHVLMNIMSQQAQRQVNLNISKLYQTVPSKLCFIDW